VLEEDGKGSVVTNELLTERVKIVNAGNDGVCLCVRRAMNMFADLGLIYPLRDEQYLRCGHLHTLYSDSLRFTMNVI